MFLKESVPLFLQTVVGLSVASDEQKILSLSFDEETVASVLLEPWKTS